MGSFLSRVREDIVSQRLLLRNQRVLIAVSGGIDSMVLLHVLWTLAPVQGWDVYVAHIHHQLRSDADEDEALVRSVCAQYGVPFCARSIDWQAQPREAGRSIQAEARERRYALLHQLAIHIGVSVVATGHHRDDQVETVLLRLCHGTGLRGLSAMRAMRSLAPEVALIRPFLHVSREEIEQYAQNNQISYREDPTNASMRYARNSIRHEVLPVLRRVQPKIDEHIHRLTKVCAEEDDFLSQLAEEALRKLVPYMSAVVSFERAAFLAIPVALQRRLLTLLLIQQHLQPHAIESQHVFMVQEAIVSERPTTGEWHIASDLVLVRAYEQIWLGPRTHVFLGARKEQVLDVAVASGRITDPILDWSQRPCVEGRPWWNAPLSEAWFDAEALQVDEVVVRSWRPGERIALLGSNGSKKVSDVLGGAKVPLAYRKNWPMIAWRQGTVLWIPGIRRSRHALVTERSRWVIHMRCDYRPHVIEMEERNA